MESLKSTKEIVKFCEERGVEMIHLWFVDILGQLKSVGITLRVLQDALDEGVGIDGSSVEGFARIYESDLVAMPDPSTFQMLPWKVNGENVGRLICDILNPDGTPYEGDTRHVLKRALKRIDKLGYTFYLGPEAEYFYFKGLKDRTLLDSARYFDQVPDDIGTELRTRTVEALQAMDISVEAWRSWRAEYDWGTAVQPGVRRDALRFVARWLYTSGMLPETRGSTSGRSRATVRALNARLTSLR